MVVKSFQDLIAWQKAMVLVEAVYQATRPFPPAEAYGLTSQLRRAAVSIPSNIAEGHGRGTTGELLHHLSIAQGSACELETQVLIAARLGLLDESGAAHLISLIHEVGRLMRGLSRALTSRPSPIPRPRSPSPSH